MFVKNKLPVLEIFSSIQGEGCFEGKNVTEKVVFLANRE